LWDYVIFITESLGQGTDQGRWVKIKHEAMEKMKDKKGWLD